MKKAYHIFLFSTLTLVLLTGACSGQQGSATPAGAALPGELTSSPTAMDAGTPAPPETTTITTTAVTITRTATTPTVAVTGSVTATNTTLTPKIPVTGDIVLLECQYCIEGLAHALLVLPDTATFEVVNSTASLSTPGPDMGCKAVDTFGGRQTVICRAQENTSLTLNICANGTDCTQLDVKLQACPLTGTKTPTYP